MHASQPVSEDGWDSGTVGQVLYFSTTLYCISQFELFHISLTLLLYFSFKFSNVHISCVMSKDACKPASERGWDSKYCISLQHAIVFLFELLHISLTLLLYFSFNCIVSTYSFSIVYLVLNEQAWLANAIFASEIENTTC